MLRTLQLRKRGHVVSVHVPDPSGTVLQRCLCRSRSGISAVETGGRLLPLSLLLFAAGVPKVLPDISPRLVVRLGFMALFAGLVLLVGLLDVGAGPEIVTRPLLIAGAGLGALPPARQRDLSSVPGESSGEAGGLSRTPALSSARQSAPHSQVPCSSPR